MSNEVESFKVGGLTVKLFFDEYSRSPREDRDPVGKMVCWHNYYNLGDEQPREDPEAWFESLLDSATQERVARIDAAIDSIPGCYNSADRAWQPTPSKAETYAWLKRERGRSIRQFVEDNYVLLPLYLYDHSGLTMRTTPFNYPWDSSQIGWIYVSMDDARKEWSGTDDEVREKAEKYLRGEVEEYDTYLRGDIYGYCIEDQDGQEVASCWGLYGYDYAKEEATSEARVLAESLPKQFVLEV